MEWEFTPEQVVKAEADYGFDDFRRDLYREVQMNSGDLDPREIKATFDLLYDLCYWLATGRMCDDFIAQYRHSPSICEFLESVAPAMAANAEMLGAILQRMIMVEVEAGLPLKEGVLRVHGAVVQKALTPA